MRFDGDEGHMRGTPTIIITLIERGEGVIEIRSGELALNCASLLLNRCYLHYKSQKLS